MKCNLKKYISRSGYLVFSALLSLPCFHLDAGELDDLHIKVRNEKKIIRVSQDRYYSYHDARALGVHVAKRSERLGNMELFEIVDKSERIEIYKELSKSEFIHHAVQLEGNELCIADAKIYIELDYSSDWIGSLQKILTSIDHGGVRIITSPLGTGWDNYDYYSELLPFCSLLPPRYPSNRLEPLVAEEIAERINTSGRIRIEIESKKQNGWEVVKEVNKLADEAMILSVTPNFGMLVQSNMPAPFLPNLPNDNLFSNAGSWYLTTANFFGVSPVDGWQHTYGYTATIVAVLDSGIDVGHADLNLTEGRNFADDQDSDDYSPNDTPGVEYGQHENHATAVSGFICGIANNSIGTCGVSPGVSVMPLRIGRDYDANGNFMTQMAWIEDALNHAATHGARVTNMSIGSYDQAAWAGVETVLENIYNSHDVIHFAAAGNSSTDVTLYPAGSPFVNGVSSITNTGSLASFSNYGDSVDFCAPGEGLIFTDRMGDSGYVEGDFGVWQGTSFSSPMAAGAAALLFSYNPDLTPSEVENALIGGAVDLGDVGRDDNFGHGLINISASLDLIDPGIWIASGTIDLGNRWKFQNEYGHFNDVAYPFIFHDPHGWQYVFPDSTPENFWIFDETTDTYWSTSINPGIYPYISIENKMFYYLIGSENPRYFYDYETSAWLSDTQLYDKFHP
jgi:subtilisin family serine protease